MRFFVVFIIPLWFFGQEINLKNLCDDGSNSLNYEELKALGDMCMDLESSEEFLIYLETIINNDFPAFYSEVRDTLLRRQEKNILNQEQIQKELDILQQKINLLEPDYDNYVDFQNTINTDFIYSIEGEIPCNHGSFNFLLPLVNNLKEMEDLEKINKILEPNNIQKFNFNVLEKIKNPENFKLIYGLGCDYIFNPMCYNLVIIYSINETENHISVTKSEWIKDRSNFKKFKKFNSKILNIVSSKSGKLKRNYILLDNEETLKWKRNQVLKRNVRMDTLDNLSDITEYDFHEYNELGNKKNELENSLQELNNLQLILDDSKQVDSAYKNDSIELHRLKESYIKYPDYINDYLIIRKEKLKETIKNMDLLEMQVEIHKKDLKKIKNVYAKQKTISKTEALKGLNHLNQVFNNVVEMKDYGWLFDEELTNNYPCVKVIWLDVKFVDDEGLHFTNKKVIVFRNGEVDFSKNYRSSWMYGIGDNLDEDCKWEPMLTYPEEKKVRIDEWDSPEWLYDFRFSIDSEWDELTKNIDYKHRDWYTYH